MKTVSFISFAALLALGACSHYSDDLASLEGKVAKPAPMAVASTYPIDPQNIAPAAGTAPNQTLNATLAGEYFTMARFENDKAYDYKAAKFFTGKAKQAAEGKLVVPSKVSAFDIPAENQGELNAARGELITALKTQNTPENAQALAVAQTRYECWLERAEEAADEAHYSTCKSEFQAAMAQLVLPAAGNPSAATAYDIGFAANSAVMDESSQKSVAYLVNFLKAPENAPYTANLTGFMAAAQGEFAQNLTNARITAVRNALVEGGVEAARLNPLISAGAPEGVAGKVQVLLTAPTNSANPNVQTTTTYVPITPVQVPAGQ